MSRTQSKRRHKPAPSVSQKRSLKEVLTSDNAKFLTLSGFFVLLFLTGGSSRPDMAALIVLRPISILVLGYGLITLTASQMRQYWPVFALVIAMIALAIVQLVPLPPSIWHNLPGHSVFAQIDSILGLQDLWRPWTLDPAGTRNALMSLAVPLAVLVLGAQLGRDHQIRLLSVILALGALSVVFATLQLAGDPHGPLYLYRITNDGAAVGLFANRNHQAVFLSSLIPLLFVWARNTGRSTGSHGRDSHHHAGSLHIVIASAGAAILMLLSLVTGSRAGLMTLLISVLATGALISFIPPARSSSSAKKQSQLRRFAPLGVGILALVGFGVLTAVMGRNLALDRLLGSDPGADARADFTPQTFDLALNNLPWGTGLGSFERVYRMAEPDSLLNPAYANHAHNDFVEILLTTGLFGIVIASGFAVLLLWRLRILTRQGLANHILQIASLISLGLLTLASFVDYPIRTPALAGFCTLLLVWVFSDAQAVKRPNHPGKEFG
ncbi:O-antigen ligase domain-containing protein [Tsuneonella suprasediminis]|uniref:O-antigen ligase domain-containing protein n=1 Tax=Tsuneonella suprasediminis TaxID=2306996 RepID=A0A419QXY5_9SPHN|nr:O-antigen ligase family protein [Tsuneonella suprasediminis]RJX65560.1 O-antigen ligase domain-containing protein [Tsuneonella suprasediminis]